MNLHVSTLDSGRVTRVSAACSCDIGVYAWAGDDHLVYLEDAGGDEHFVVMCARAEGSAPWALTPSAGVRAELLETALPSGPAILLTMNQRDPEVFDVYRCDVRTGRLELVAENPGSVSTWIADHRGRLRAAVTTDGLTSRLLFRETEADDLRVVQEVSFKDTLLPLLFTFDDEHLYVASDLGRDRQAIVVYDPRAGEERRLVYEHPEVDVEGLLYSRRERRLTGVRFVTDRPEYAFFDGERARRQRDLERQLPGCVVSIEATSDDESRAVVSAQDGVTPGAVYLYDAGSGHIEELATLAPWLDTAQMAETTPMSFEARDGLAIHGYVTLPCGREARGLPLVVNPHGGPWSRDGFGYRPDVQLFANRGYAVLRVNFRGSTGYGKAFCRAGFKEWGRRMQDDLTDGVRHLIEHGIADPRRVVIYGESYGGYAALAGLAFTPDLYAAGVAVAGIADVLAWMESFPPYWRPFLETMHEMVGHPDRDRAALAAASPYFHTGAIRAPVLIAHGANDPRVPRDQSDRMVAALRQRGATVEHFVAEGEGHDFGSEESASALYRAVDRFLAARVGTESG
jgi:dipeptidyl aminopeptidase/acylaminoacyl peptidase